MANPSVVGTPTVENVASARTTITILRSGVTAGNLLALWVPLFSGATVTGMFGGGATWAKLQATTLSSVRGELWTGSGGTGGSITVSGTLSGSDFPLCSLYEIANPGTVESSAITTAASATQTVSATPTTTGDLVLTCIAYSSNTNTGTPSSPWVDANGGLNGSTSLSMTAYQANCTGGSPISATWTFSGSVNAVLGTLILSGGGGGGSTINPPQIIVPNFASQQAANW